MTKKNVGGVSFTKKWKDVPKEDILDYFLQNSDFKILTDTSVSCITYVATLREDKESPFFSVRSNLFHQPVRNLLMKVCIHNVEKQFIPDFKNNGLTNIETMSPEDINREVKIQDDIFRKSYIENIAEPICPSILYVKPDIPEDTQRKYYSWMNNHIIERNPTVSPGRDQYITYFFFNSYRLSIIFMEFAEGYYTLFDLWNNPQNQGPNEMAILKRFAFITMYELYNLYHRYGIVHGDIHFGNILVNPSYPYVDNQQLGKILIIDFGKSFYETPDPNKKEFDTILYHKNTSGFETIFNYVPDVHKNEYFQQIYKQIEEYRKPTIQLFLNHLFMGSLEMWREWSNKNIHFPHGDSIIGGLSHNKIKKMPVINIIPEKQMNTTDRVYSTDPRSHDLRDYGFTKEDWDEAARSFIHDLKEAAKKVPKGEPLSPRTAERTKKLIAEELNRPLEIEYIQNPYIYPIGNPAKVAPIIEPPSSSAAKKPKNKTKSKRDIESHHLSFETPTLEGVLSDNGDTFSALKIRKGVK
jgi:hypothetical protein